MIIVNIFVSSDADAVFGEQQGSWMSQDFSAILGVLGEWAVNVVICSDHNFNPHIWSEVKCGYDESSWICE